MTPPPVELQLALVRAHQAGDVQAARAIAAQIRQATQAPPPPAPEGGGFVPGVKVGGAGVLGALAQPVEDVTGLPTELGEYAEQVQRETPQAFTSVGAFADRPLTSTAEITGAQLPTTGAIVAGAGVGRKLGGMAGRAAGAVPFLRAVPAPIRVKAGEEFGENVGAFLPSLAMQYREARQEQDEAGTRNIPKAIIAAGGGALAEQFGLESMARRALFGKKARPGKSRAIEAGKSAVIAAPIESATEVGQTAASLWAADRDLGSPESIEKLQMSGLGGFVGGGVLGGALGAAQKPKVEAEQPPPPPPPGPAIVPEPQTEIADDIDPEIILAEADQEAFEGPPVAEEQRSPGRQEPAQEDQEAVTFPDIVMAPNGQPFRTAAQAAIFRARNKLPDREVIRMPEGGFMLAKPISVTEMQAEEASPIQQPPEPDELQAAQAYDRQILDAIALGDVELANQLRAERDALPPLQPVSTEGIEVSYQPPQAPEGEGRMEVSYPEVENITLSAPPEMPETPKTPEAEAVLLQNRDRSSAASIEQMNSIAANPDPARLSFSRDLSAGAPVVFRQDDRMPAILGRKDVVTDASGKKIPVQYALVEADDVVASNRVDGLPDPEYTNPERTRAIAGNGRVAGLKAAFERGTAPDYVEGIAADADLHGIPDQAVRALNKPILVRVMRAQDVTPDIGDRSNIQTAARLSPIEQARTDAARVDLANLDFDDAGRPTQESLTAFVSAMPQTEQSELRLRAGQTGKQATDRLMAAVFAKAYGDPALVELYAQASEPEAKAVMTALAGAAGAMQKLEGAGDLDVRSIVVDAARAAVNSARRGQKLQVYADQGDLNIEPDAFRVIRFMAANGRSGKAMAEGLRNIASLAYAESQKPDADMFGPVERAARSQVLEVLDEKTPVAVPGRTEAAGRDAGVRESVGTDAEPVPELTLTTQTEDDFRRQDAERKQREADERERGRRAKAGAEPFRLTGSEREADQAAAAGQAALPLEAEKPAAPKAAKPNAPSVVPSAVSAAVQQDLFAGYPEAKDDTGQYATEAELVKTGTREIGAAKVVDVEQAAKAMSYLGRNAVERFDALVTDKDGQPLAIVGGFKGTIDAASVYIRTLIGEVFGLPGAARVWFAHNHPSGNTTLSKSDLLLAQAASRAFSGTKVRMEGIFAFAGAADGPRKWAFDDGFGSATQSGVAPAFAQAGAVPIMERILSKSGTLGPEITSQSEAISAVPAIARDRAGIVMLNSQHVPIGFATIPKADQFRDTGALDNLYEALAMGNANSVLIANPNNQYSLAEMMNLAAAVQRGGMEVRALDAVSYSYADGEPSNVDLLSRTSPQFRLPITYKSIARKKASSTVEAARAAAVKEYGEQAIENLERAGILRILDSADLPKEIYDPEADALYDPKTATAYIIADRVSGDRIPQLMLHEIGEHYGLPRMLGAKKYNELIQQVRQMIAEGKDPELSAAVQDVRDNYALDENSTLFVREVIARYSENPGKAQWWQDLVAMMRQFLRDLGIIKNMSPKDVAYLVRQSLRQAMRTAPRAQYPGRPIESPTMAAKEPTQAALMRSMMADTFYSALLRSVQDGKGAPKRGDAKMWKGWLDGAQRRGEFRQPERDWLGVDAWLDAREAVTRDELADFIRAAALAGQPMSSRNPARSVLPDETSFESIVRLMQNQMNRWDKGLDYLRAKGGNIVTYKTDVSSIEKLFYGKAQNDYNIMKRRFMAPIEKILKQNDLSLDELDKFAMYRHAPERNKAIAKIDPTKPDGGSGIMTEDAKKYMQELTGERRAVLTKAGDLLLEMNRWRLAKQRDSGLISDEEFRVLTQKYEFYVPLKSVKEPEDVVDGLGATGYSVRGKEFQRALGRSSEAASPYLVSVMDATRAILRAQKDAVGNAAYELGLNPGARELVEIIDPAGLPEQFQVKKIYKVAKKDANGRILRRPVMEDGKQVYRNGKAVTEPVMEERVGIGIDSSYPNSRNIFATKIKGETKYVLIKDERMAEQLKKMGEAEMNAFMETLNRATGLMGRMFTQYNPAFIPINFMRDMLTVTINSLGVPGMSPGRVFAGTFESMPAIYSHLFGDGSSALTPTYSEFLEDGATTGGLGLTGSTQAGKELQERGVRLKAGESAPVRQAIGRMKDMLDVVSNVNEVFENATRFAVYRNAREVFTQQNLDAGMSRADAVADARQRAAVLAREISVDFNKRGEYSRMMNSFYVFFNAAVQGVRSFYKFTMTSQQKNRVQQALFGIMMSGVALRFYNHIIGGFDDELGEEKALAFDAQATMSAPLLLGDTVLKFPLPYIYNIPFVLGYRMADMYITGRVGHNLKEIAMTASGALSPLGEPKVASGTPAGFIAKTFSPSVIQPMADILDNTNFYGGPIAKTPSLWDKAPPPRAYDHWKGSSEAGVAVAKMLNYMTGGDKYEPGWLNVAPEWLDYITSYYAGGPGRFIKQTYSLVTPDEAGQETPKSQYPIIGRLYVERQPRYYINGRFREMQTELEYVKKRMEDRSSGVQPEDRRLVAAFESTEKRLRVMQKQLNKAVDGGNEERAQALRDRIQAQKAQAIKSYNVVKGRYDEAVAGATKAEAAELFRQNGKPAMAGLIQETQ